MKNLAKNTAWASMAVLVLGLGLGGCASTKENKSTGQYIDDAAITTKVKSQMIADKEVSAHEINVDTSRGVVRLTGSVQSRYEANKAAAIARGVNGVRSVDNNIQVK